MFDDKPEIALNDLLNDDNDEFNLDEAQDGPPSFEDLFGEESDAKEKPEKPEKDFLQKKDSFQEKDFSKEEFPEITNFEQESDPIFFEKDFYPKVLAGEGKIAHKIHTLLQQFLKGDTSVKSETRPLLITAWHELTKKLAHSFQSANGNEKRWAIRFSYILPLIISDDQRNTLSKIIHDNKYDEPVHYIDEWLILLNNNAVTPLAGHEDAPIGKSSNKKTKAQIDNALNSRPAVNTLLKTLYGKQEELESSLKNQVQLICKHSAHPKFQDYPNIYTAEQSESIAQITLLARQLRKNNSDISEQLKILSDLTSTITAFDSSKDNGSKALVMDENILTREMEQFHGMMKITIGRLGNHFPFLKEEYFSSNIDAIATRENVLVCMKQLEEIDSDVFKRTFRQTTMRIVPHTILLPCYGTTGVCWEPFERTNRHTSRGRIAIPMFSGDVKTSVIYALGDLRWNVAKESSGGHWTQEGLTGDYFQWFTKRGFKGDVKQRFLEDYFIWITKEVTGIQKLDKEVRGIFWRRIPFQQSIKDDLRDRGFVYNELYKKDFNRFISSGY